jgi:hypothetical protein
MTRFLLLLDSCGFIDVELSLSLTRGQTHPLIYDWTNYIVARRTHWKTSVAQQWIYTNHIENNFFCIVVFTARCIVTEVFRLLPACSSPHYSATGGLPRICLHGSVFIQLLPSSGSIHHNILTPILEGILANFLTN